jgi:hypothetical protein
MSDSFALNYFRWALAYSDKEVEEGFLHIRKFEEAAFLLKQMSFLDMRRKRLLARGLVRRFHSCAVSILREPTDAEEEELVQWYLQSGTKAFTTGEWRTFKPACGNRLPRPELRRRALASMGGRLGNPAKCDVPGAMVFESPVEGREATIRTFVFLRVRGADLAYFQELWVANGDRTATGISALSWLGITGGPCAWRTVGEGNVEQALEAIRAGGAEFISAVPNLL